MNDIEALVDELNDDCWQTRPRQIMDAAEQALVLYEALKSSAIYGRTARQALKLAATRVQYFIDKDDLYGRGDGARQKRVHRNFTLFQRIANALEMSPQELQLVGDEYVKPHDAEYRWRCTADAEI